MQYTKTCYAHPHLWVCIPHTQLTTSAGAFTLLKLKTAVVRMPGGVWKCSRTKEHVPKMFCTRGTVAKLTQATRKVNQNNNYKFQNSKCHFSSKVQNPRISATKLDDQRLPAECTLLEKCHSLFWDHYISQKGMQTTRIGEENVPELVLHLFPLPPSNDLCIIGSLNTQKLST